MKTTVFSKERGYKKLKEGISIETYREKYPSTIKAKAPSFRTMEKWILNGVAKSIDGCRVEPDGECEHGYPSWFLVLSYI